jgi:hypothetical protein
MAKTVISPRASRKKTLKSYMLINLHQDFVWLIQREDT